MTGVRSSGFGAAPVPRALRIGLTGGIASGKSTVAARLAELGATLIDSDVLAREVVAVGTPGLAAVIDRFGRGVLDDDGRLDRAALGRIVFGDPAARADLEAIIHPLVLRRTEQLMAAARPGEIVVHDIPLLVELKRADRYDLVLIVGADAEVRRRRLVTDRGMDGAEADRRIAAQADDTARRAVADVWLDNDGTREALLDQVDRAWATRILPLSLRRAGGG